MRWDMKSPCDNCPFRREGGIKLRPARIREIAGMMLESQGGTFPCHKTVDYEGDEPRVSRDAQHCAGAVAFALKHDTLPQVARIAERFRLLDAEAIFQESGDLVWDSINQWLKGGAVNRSSAAAATPSRNWASNSLGKSGG